MVEGQIEFLYGDDQRVRLNRPSQRC